jgi:hypothetical protein
MAIFNRNRAQDAAADAADNLEEISHDLSDTARAFVDRATDETSDAAARAGGAAARAGEAAAKATVRLADRATQQLDRMAKELKLEERIDRVAKDLKLEDRIDDVVTRVRDELPEDAAERVMARIQRELPDTDKDRYDRAFQRGFARARSAYVFSGLALGAAAGVVGALLFDPDRGRSRRAYLASRFEGIKNDAVRTASSKSDWASDRARGIAMEKGIIAKPNDTSSQRPPAPAGVHVWSEGTTVVHPDPGTDAEREPSPRDRDRRPVAATPASDQERTLTPAGTNPAEPGEVRAESTFEAEPREPIAAGTVAAEGHEDRATTMAGPDKAGATGAPGGTPSPEETDTYRTSGTTGDISGDPARVEPGEPERRA